MLKELKEKWIAALESGKYQQAKGKLKRVGDTYCCLGVLCDISGDGEWKEMTPGAFEYFMSDGSEGFATELPKSLKARAAIPGTTELELVRMNDGVGEKWVNNRQSFAQIAQYIREYL